MEPYSGNAQKPTGVVYDEDVMLKHLSLWDQHHEEKPERILAILKRCRELDLLERCKRIPCRPASEAELLMCHSQNHLTTLAGISHSVSSARLEELASSYQAVFFHPATHNAAVLAAGSTVSLVDAIIDGTIKNGMAIIRPPGHHASANEFSGYCYLNNVAVAAGHAAMRRLRVLVVDWDVHHGQGTQEAFYDNDRVMYVSLHRYEYGSFWPELRESNYDHTGMGPGTGYNWNIPLNVTGMADQDLMAVWHRLVLPAAYEFAPDLVMVSAGFDAALGCPQGEMSVTPACFAHLTLPLMALASGRLALVLEGGYCLPSLAESAAMSLRTLLGDPPPRLPPLPPPCQSLEESVLDVVSAQHMHWGFLTIYDTYTPPIGVTSPLTHADVHVPVNIYRGTPAPTGATHPTRGDFPLQSEEEKKQFADKLEQLRKTTDLTVPPRRVALCRLPPDSATDQSEEAVGSLSGQLLVLDSSPGEEATHAVCKVVDAVLEGQATAGLLVTPHHVAVSATRHALHRRQRVLVVDYQTSWQYDWSRAVQCPEGRGVAVTISASGCDVFNLHEDPPAQPQPADSPGSDFSYPQSPLEADSPQLTTWGASEVLSLIFQLVLPVAYQLSPEIVILSVTSLSEEVTSSLVSHVVHQLSAPAGGRIVVVSSDDAPLATMLGRPPSWLPATVLPSAGAMSNLRRINFRERRHWAALPVLKAVPENGDPVKRVARLSMTSVESLEKEKVPQSLFTIYDDSEDD